MKKQMGVSALPAAFPMVQKTSVRLWVRLTVVYSSLSCTEREKVFSPGSKDTTRALIASNGFWIKCLNFSTVLIFLKKAWEQLAI